MNDVVEKALESARAGLPFFDAPSARAAIAAYEAARAAKAATDSLDFIQKTIDDAAAKTITPASEVNALSARIAALEEAELGALAAGSPVHDALMDSQYLVGAKAGWNAAQSERPDEAYAAIVKSREGYLKPITDLRRARAVLEVEK